MKRRYFGTYNGRTVEYFQESREYGTVRLGDDSLVYEENITPSPYPWQFHTREFWDAHPGMRWAFWSWLCDAWFLTNGEKPRDNGGGYDGKFDFVTITNDLPMWDGPSAISLFENPFWRNYPAELDDPKTWEQWPTAICGAWDKSGRFYCYSVIPKLGAGHDGSCWIGIMIDEDESAFNGTFTGDWRESLIMRPAPLPDVLLSPALYEQIMGRGKRSSAKAPMVKYPKAAPNLQKRALRVATTSPNSIVFYAETKAARAWLTSQAPMFGTLETNTMSSGKFYLATDFPHAAMKYLIDGFYNRRPDVIRKHYPDVTAEPENKPRIEKRTIQRIMKMGDHVLFVLSESPIYQTVTITTTLDLMQRFGVLSYTDLIGKQIAVRIAADKLIIVEDGE